MAEASKASNAIALTTASDSLLRTIQYQGCRLEIRRLIVPMTINGSGIRDITRVLGVSINTVLKTIRQAAAQITEPRVPARITDLQIDEMCRLLAKRPINSGSGTALKRRASKSSVGRLGGVRMRLASICCRNLARARCCATAPTSGSHMRSCCRRSAIGSAKMRRKPLSGTI
jgi:Insertion element protein.